jgi:hypothetical protein
MSAFIWRSYPGTNSGQGPDETSVEINVIPYQAVDPELLRCSILRLITHATYRRCVIQEAHQSGGE